jgi:hypothetical protein
MINVLGQLIPITFGRLHTIYPRLLCWMNGGTLICNIQSQMTETRLIQVPKFDTCVRSIYLFIYFKKTLKFTLLTRF